MNQKRKEKEKKAACEWIHITSERNCMELKNKATCEWFVLLLKEIAALNSKVSK